MSIPWPEPPRKLFLRHDGDYYFADWIFQLKRVAKDFDLEDPNIQPADTLSPHVINYAAQQDQLIKIPRPVWRLRGFTGVELGFSLSTEEVREKLLQAHHYSCVDISLRHVFEMNPPEGFRRERIDGETFLAATEEYPTL